MYSHRSSKKKTHRRVRKKSFWFAFEFRLTRLDWIDMEMFSQHLYAFVHFIIENRFDIYYSIIFFSLSHLPIPWKLFSFVNTYTLWNEQISFIVDWYGLMGECSMHWFYQCSLFRERIILSDMVWVLFKVKKKNKEIEM